MDVITLAEAGFEPDTEDAIWIPAVAAQHWVILTKDRRIRRDSVELNAVLTAGAFYFVLGGANYTADQMAGIILYHRPTIERLVRHREPPIVAQLNKTDLLLRDNAGDLRPAKRRG